jgi:hypothetical protein
MMWERLSSRDQLSKTKVKSRLARDELGRVEAAPTSYIIQQQEE